MKKIIPVFIHDAVFTPVNQCVRCKRKLDAVTGLQSKVPKEGDFSVCGYCGQLMVFAADQKLRAATDLEMSEFRTTDPNSYILAELLSRFFVAKHSQREN